MCWGSGAAALLGGIPEAEHASNSKRVCALASARTRAPRSCRSAPTRLRYKPTPHLRPVAAAALRGEHASQGRAQAAVAWRGAATAAPRSCTAAAAAAGRIASCGLHW